MTFYFLIKILASNNYANKIIEVEVINVRPSRPFTMIHLFCLVLKIQCSPFASPGQSHIQPGCGMFTSTL